MGLRRIYCLVLLLGMSLALPVASADSCLVSSPRYQLVMDTVSWAIRVRSGKTCISSFRFNDIANQSVKLVSPPQAGQVKLRGGTFLYTAKPDFEGQDSFTVVVSGSIEKTPGNSTIRIAVSVVGEPSGHGVPASGDRPRTAEGRIPDNAPSRPEGRAGGAWHDLRIGGGGFVTGMAIAPDGTQIARTDTYGGYVWFETEWIQVLTATSMPAGTFGIGNNDSGLYEFAVCGGNTNVAYMMPADGFIYKSTNLKSGSPVWTKTAFAGVSGGVNPNSASRTMGKFAACDPANTAGNVILFGSPSNGVAYSTDGGSTWSTISAVGAASSAANNLIAFDPTSPVTGSGSNAVTQGIFISTSGKGVYHSTAGPGGTFGLLPGTPTTHKHMIVDQKGNLWLLADAAGNNLHKYANGSWSTPTLYSSGGYHSVAVDPANANHVVLSSSGGYLNTSTDGGATWPNHPSDDTTIVNGDTPWQARGSTFGPYLSGGDIAFDPLQPGTLVFAWGFGILTADPYASKTSVAWSPRTKGIEGLVASNVLATPDGTYVLGAQDLPVWQHTASDYNTNASLISPSAPYGSLHIGFSFDYVPGTPSTIVGIISGDMNESLGADLSGISNDGGLTWTQFAGKPPIVTGNGGGADGGNIAAASTTNFCWISAGANRSPYYTTNGGKSWTSATGLTGTFLGLDYFTSLQFLVADKVNIGTFYAYLAGKGFYRSTNGCQTWSLVHSGVLDPAHEGASSVFKANPLVAGDLLYSAGYQQGAPHPVNMNMYRSTDAGATWNTINGFREVISAAWGAQVPGQPYPILLLYGWYNEGAGTNYTLGNWQSTDNGKTFTNIGAYPLGNFQVINMIDGDKQNYGRWIAAVNGSGFRIYLP
jgi:hypothetical protein